MTEQEIVDYLKQNVDNGIAYDFMPGDVKKWAVKNSTALIHYIDKEWKKIPDKNHFKFSDIVGLSDDFELTKKNDGWVEFEIDPNGGFFIDLHASSQYHWSCWGEVLKDFYFGVRDYDYDLTAFGGWQYESSTKWYLTPRIERRKYSVGFELADSYFEGDDTKILTPVRIRFWKEYKKR